METIALQNNELETMSSLRKQVNQLKELVGKEKGRADTLSFILENKDKMLKKFEKEQIKSRQKINLLESKIQELKFESQESPQASEDSFVLQNEKNAINICSGPKFMKPGASAQLTAHEQIEITLLELNRQKSMTNSKKLEIKSYKERILMCIEEMKTKEYEYKITINQLETNNQILSDQIQVINDSLSEKENDKIVHEQTMYELEDVKASKATLLTDIKNLYTEKDAIHKKYLAYREEFCVLQASINSKDMTIRELELEFKVLNEKIRSFEDKERVYEIELASLRRNSLTSTGSFQQMGQEREVIALQTEVSELNHRLEEKNKVITEIIQTKEEAIQSLQKENKELIEKHKQEIEIKSQEFIQQPEEAANELLKQHEQLAAKLQVERRNTMLEWKKAMSIKDPTLLISDEIFKLRGVLAEKEKEIARLNQNNKELKACWKDSARLLKAVWKQSGDETKKIDEAVRRRAG
ncbi:hypothetical protein SteCoe_18672 [Stentor coeruleus]|uniref:Uncharacterized protein n=1 Tax=Stentor coeruleus TaxID=5963 RepID=A0A1R2BW18_9CILI|nr:hypothetical protein SteCoe_18672 [Stentor coeruleus]